MTQICSCKHHSFTSKNLLKVIEWLACECEERRRKMREREQNKVIVHGKEVDDIINELWVTNMLQLDCFISPFFEAYLLRFLRIFQNVVVHWLSEDWKWNVKVVYKSDFKLNFSTQRHLIFYVSNKTESQDLLGSQSTFYNQSVEFHLSFPAHATFTTINSFHTKTTFYSSTWRP